MTRVIHWMEAFVSLGVVLVVLEKLVHSYVIVYIMVLVIRRVASVHGQRSVNEVAI